LTAIIIMGLVPVDLVVVLVAALAVDFQAGAAASAAGAVEAAGNEFIYRA
jgi:hypothetical protein